LADSLTVVGRRSSVVVRRSSFVGGRSSFVGRRPPMDHELILTT